MAQPGSPFPPTTVTNLRTDEPLHLHDGSGWRLIVVYRGHFCPLCQQYLKALEPLLPEYAEAGVSVTVVSTCGKDTETDFIKQSGYTGTVGYGLTLAQGRALGLHISNPRNEKEAKPFAEPGVFLINPEGLIHIVDISNAPFTRPDLAKLLFGIKFIQQAEYPIRGTNKDA